MSMETLPVMPTIEEREKLMKTVVPHYGGFTPRPIEQLARRRKPKTSLNIECSHFLRTNTDSFTHGHHNLEYRLWLEAGKHNPPFPQKPDTSYNSNVWRNFRRQFGFDVTADGRKISDIIAAMYPLNIPPPSKVGRHTFEKYIRESKLFENEKYKMMAIHRTKADVQEFKRLKAKTEARNPPLDEDGNILPPENFKRHLHQFVPPPEPPPSPPPPNLKTDVFGQRYVPRSKPHLWKLTHALNNPEYEAVRKEVEKRAEMMEKWKAARKSQFTPAPMSPSVE